VLVRFTLPIRDIALSPNEEWIAVSSDEVEVKVVNRHDIEQIYILRNHSKPVKHLSYDPSGKWLTASCTDGKIYMYSMDGEPKFVKALDGIIQRFETADNATSKCFWHPAGKVFATATASREIVIVSAEDGEVKQRFKGVHNSPITSIAWSYNGRMLASSSYDGMLVLWDAKTQQVLQQNTYERIIHITWHNKDENLFCWSNDWGEVYIVSNFLKNPTHLELLKAPVDSLVAPGDPAPQAQNRPAGKPEVNGVRPLVNSRPRAASLDSLDDFLNAGGDDNWIDDDDGAGYKNENGKRSNGHLGSVNGDSKRHRYDGTVWQPRIHDAFQPGSTSWKGNRRYLTLNLTGTVWTVDQQTHNTITVEFYDRTMHRDFHITDPFKYDKACLSEHGTLFSCASDDSVTPPQPSMLFYRPHETWTNRADFRVSLPPGEDIACIALSTKYIVACTTANYVRVYTLFGTPVTIWRLKSSPAVTCAAHGDYIITISNGAVNSDGSAQLVYSIEDVKHDITHQSSDLVALGTPHPDADDFDARSVTLKSVFWTDTGDPAIYDSTGTLLVLLHWRNMGQAKWIPLLDTRNLERLRTGRKEETYWPVALANDKFHCIILKGGDTTPSWPRPLLTEFELEIPIAHQPITTNPDPSAVDGEESTASQTRRLEESYVRTTLTMALLDDLIQSHGDHARYTDKTELARREIEVDKILLQLLAAECRQGEETGMKALEVVGLMRDRSGKMIEAASKIAGRFGRTVLEDKIRELGERRLMGVEEG